MKVQIGGAADSWGIWFSDDRHQMPWQRFLDEVAEAGYGWLELGPYGYLPTDLTVLRSELDRRGLKISANWAMAPLEDVSAWPELERQVLGCPDEPRAARAHPQGGGGQEGQGSSHQDGGHRQSARGTPRLRSSGEQVGEDPHRSRPQSRLWAQLRGWQMVP